MDIIIGSDHAGYELKSELVRTLNERGLSVRDVGADGPESVDYPDFGSLVAEAVRDGKVPRGILICGTGIGMSMVANKFRGIRAALCTEPFSAQMSRKHNDSNILVLGARVTGVDLAREILLKWLDTPFEGGRHQGRLNKIVLIEKSTKSLAEGDQQQ